MENMDKELTVPNLALLNLPKVPQMPPKFSSQLVRLRQKVWDFRKKLSLSLVRVLFYSSEPLEPKRRGPPSELYFNQLGG